MSKILFLSIDRVLNDIISHRKDDTLLPWKIDESFSMTQISFGNLIVELVF